MTTKKTDHLETRRGLSTVVGAIFMTIIIGSAMNLALWTLQQQDKVTQALVEKANTNQVKFNENLYFSDVKISNNKLNLTISNDVATAAKLTALYVVNETSQQQYKYDLDIVVDGRDTVNIGQSDPSIIIQNYTRYSIKIVSESGNSVTARIRPVSEIAFPMSLFVVPPSVTTLENVTLLFSVTNNLTGGDIFASEVTPILSKSLSCGNATDCMFTDRISPSPATIPNGNTALFKWVFQVTAPVGTTMTFNASLANAKAGNYVVETGEVVIVQEAATTSEIIVGNELLQKPEVYMITPGPFGDQGSGSSTYRGYWGVVMVNPINIDMTIKMIAINIYSSNLASSHQIIGNSCSAIGVTPSTGWDCPHDGVIRWQNLDNPVTLKGHSAYTFMVKAQPGSIPEKEPAFMLSISVFTNFGQFARQGYASAMYDSTAPIVNVYLTDTNDTSQATQDSHVFGNLTLTSGTTGRRIYVAIADFENTGNTASQINSGATLIINVPRHFSNVVVPDAGSMPPGFASATATTYSDGTVQIRAVTNEAIGDQTSSEAKVFYFDVNVPSTSTTKAYAMHTFIEGRANTATAFPADAFGTFALIVCPSSGCT
jgi:hypothetical protein